MPKSSKRKSRYQSTERPKKKEYYTVILDNYKEDSLDLNIWITILN